VLGLAIGLVSSLLGVAGGELIIPTLVFGFGVGIKTAGTASLLISLPTVVVGLVRYASRGSLSDRDSLRETVAPTGVGSVIGALIGGGARWNRPGGDPEAWVAGHPESCQPCARSVTSRTRSGDHR
jgi:uncharacterized membrane protein YfcA